MLEHADVVFRLHAENILQLDLGCLTEAPLCSYPLSAKFPQCHDLARRLVGAFLMPRLRIVMPKMNEKEKLPNAKCASKSIGMRALVRNVPLVLVSCFVVLAASILWSDVF